MKLYHANRYVIYVEIEQDLFTVIGISNKAGKRWTK